MEEEKGKLIKELGEELCNYCPWRNGEVEHTCNAVCDGNYCEDAYDAFMEDNSEYLDDYDE